MTEHKASPKSGDKIINDVGVKAIKNGQKRRTDEQAPRGDKPKWLRFVSPGGEGYQAVKKNCPYAPIVNGVRRSDVS